MVMVSTLCVSKPGSTASSFMNVRISNAAPITRTSASAISVTTSTERSLPLRKPMPERLLLSLSVAARLGLDALIAGTRPKRIPVSTETPRVKSRTVGSRVTAEPVFADAGKIAGVDGEQQADADESENEAQQASGQRERKALGQQLADDLEASGAERGAGCEFALSYRGAHQQEIGDVGAGNEKNEADRAEQNQQRLPGIADRSIPAARRHCEAILRDRDRRGIRGGTGRRRVSIAHWPVAASRRA